jgi:hypothetical protein
MLNFNSGQFRSVNSDQLATATDRMLSGRVQRLPVAPRGSVPIIDQETGEIVRYRPRDKTPVTVKLLVFLAGMALGMAVMFFGVWI